MMGFKEYYHKKKAAVQNYIANRQEKSRAREEKNRTILQFQAQEAREELKALKRSNADRMSIAELKSYKEKHKAPNPFGNLGNIGSSSSFGFGKSNFSFGSNEDIFGNMFGNEKKRRKR